MKKYMCAQMEILEKIRKKGRVNGYDIDLAEAQAKDYMSMKRRLDNIETDVNAIKVEQARQGGMIEAIFNRLNSPVEEERLAGQKWNLLASIAKNKTAWVILIIFLVAIALAGEKIVGIIDKLI
jgi:hypothetical protein